MHQAGLASHHREETTKESGSHCCASITLEDDIVLRPHKMASTALAPAIQYGHQAVAFQPGRKPAIAATVPKSPTQASEPKMPFGQDQWMVSGR